MPPLSEFAKGKKARYFLDRIPTDSDVLEIGCGGGWVKDYLRNRSCIRYVGIDLVEPAEIVGDIRSWSLLGLQPESFDVIVAFEVVEHVDCFRACYELLRPGGSLMITTPVPHMDWALKLLETLGLNQKRTSPHSNLIRLSQVPYFQHKAIRTVAFLSQWGILTKDSK
jgi:2-polyprenyl-3-methyl-5-hydroxy-6-metoxy-1,4-benzoquinol methylase